MKYETIMDKSEGAFKVRDHRTHQVVATYKPRGKERPRDSWVQATAHCRSLNGFSSTHTDTSL